MSFSLLWLGLVFLSFVTKRSTIMQWYKFSREFTTEHSPHYKRYRKYGVLSFCTVAVLSMALYSFVPLTRWGWLFSLLSANSDSSRDTASYFSTIITCVTVMVMSAILWRFLPQFAYQEEQAFRRNTINASQVYKVYISLMFGLVHMVMGIPLAVALAIGVSGYIFAHVAQKEYDRATAEMSAEQEQQLVAEDPPVEGSFDDLYQKFTESVTEFNNDQQCLDRAMLASTQAHLMHNQIALGLLISTQAVILAGVILPVIGVAV